MDLVFDKWGIGKYVIHPPSSECRTTVGVACRTLSHIVVDGSAGWSMHTFVRVKLALGRKGRKISVADTTPTPAT